MQQHLDGTQVNHHPWWDWEWESDQAQDQNLNLPRGLSSEQGKTGPMENEARLPDVDDFQASFVTLAGLPDGDGPPHFDSEPVDGNSFSLHGKGMPSSTSSLAREDSTSRATEPSKGGSRFPHTSVKVLRAWFLAHMERPYPSVGEVEALQDQTGLSKKQIMNWFANTRRRLKHQTRSLHAASSAATASAPRQRSASPAPFHQLDPLQRWQNSPPESEPVSASAIARAIANLQDDSMCPSRPGSPFNVARARETFGVASSTSSLDMSHSGGSSYSSMYSCTSRDSYDSNNLFARAPKRRRRRRQPGPLAAAAGKVSLRQTSQPFQCTFCTETFKTKYNWQRHEKSFHMSLETWQCSPNGPVFMNLDFEPACVYCGLVDPDQSHLATHNHDICENRLIQDRTYYRKDHLRQHLKLVHNTQFRPQPMDCWKFESREVRSQCGFCGLIMTNWDQRAEHIAEHFRTGKTMADWKGSWGFESQVLEMVENSIPPYLIHYESSSPWPFTTQQGPPATPTSAFELIQLELEYYVTTRNPRGANPEPPRERELHYEACCIILGSEIHIREPSKPTPSWLRDVLMSSEEIAQEARFRPLKPAAKTRLTQLSIHGKEGIFEACSLENHLQKYVEAPKLLGLAVEDTELQREACDIVRRAESSWPSQTGVFGNLLVRLICGSASWLAAFRQRAGLAVAHPPAGVPVATASDPAGSMTLALSAVASDPRPDSERDTPESFSGQSAGAAAAAPFDRAESFAQTFSHDENCYRRLTRELSWFVARTMSKHNPSRHVPTDAELQHQARCIMFDDDDPWNQTPADNRYWLEEFKRNAGLPGLPPR